MRNCSFAEKVLADFNIETTKVTTDCSQRGCLSNISEIKQELKSHCPWMLHNLLNYDYTLANGGYFPWMKDRSKVVVQCLNCEGPTVSEVSISDNKTKYKILNASKLCPYYEKEQEYSFSLIYQNICFYKLSSILPWLCNKFFFDSNLEVSSNCGFGDNPSEFTIAKETKLD